VRLPRRILAATIGLLLAGCGTVAGLVGHFEPERLDCAEGDFVPRVYAGVFGDIALLRRGTAEQELVWFDLPFSLVADTLVLPWTLVTQILHGNLCPRAGQPVAALGAPD
jgi:uncharacterized protein YceK